LIFSSLTVDAGTAVAGNTALARLGTGLARVVGDSYRALGL
jgi:hypothetical protein